MTLVNKIGTDRAGGLTNATSKELEFILTCVTTVLVMIFLALFRKS